MKHELQKNMLRKDWLTIKEASMWASSYTNKYITPSNISYLVQYGRIYKHHTAGSILVSKSDLEKYYDTFLKTKESQWKKQLGSDLNWHLSFANYKESETTKHVHRLHSYKGKFIPQLVEYFLDRHVDAFKKKCFFKEGDIVLDPFCGSGTTLVQANELNLHSIGIDVSYFNAFMSNIKVKEHNISSIKHKAYEITQKLRSFQSTKSNVAFENKLLEELKVFNHCFFPSPEFRYKVRKKKIDEKSKEFLTRYYKLVNDYNIVLKQSQQNLFLDKWFLEVVRKEIDFVFQQIKLISDSRVKDVLSLILSRTVRSCRATTHADLATLKVPMIETYYCKKHGKICKPVFSIIKWWTRYVQDTLERLTQFSKIRTKTLQTCLVGDSRSLDIMNQLKDTCSGLEKITRENDVAGIFSSPPYVGLIDYHEQHAYAYDLFDFNRQVGSEIGPLCKGQGFEARRSYIQDIANVLNHCKKILKQDYNIFLVANDKYNLYPQIARLANMKITNRYKRPVLNRVEKNRAAYSETIFHLKESSNE